MNKRINIFDGNTTRAKYARAAYTALMTREWISNEDVLRVCLEEEKKKAKQRSRGDDNTDDYQPRINLSEHSMCSVLTELEYANLKRGVRDVIGALEKRFQGDDDNAIETRGGATKGRKIRYAKDEDDPLSYLFKDIAYKELKEYLNFCFDSIGFFPHEWLEYFFKNSIDFFEIENKRQGYDVISSSLDNVLKNKGLLPILYQHIKNKHVIEFVYEEYKGKAYKVLLHPHYLKEYNGRWNLFGYTQKENAEKQIRSYGLDRIDPISIFVRDSVTYCAAPKNYYRDFFAHRIGLSKNNYGDIPELIKIRTLNPRMHGIVKTKPFIKGQKTTIEFGEHEDGRYGEITFTAIINNELMGKILQMGEGLQVIDAEGPNNLPRLMAEKVGRISNLYKKPPVAKES